MRRRYHIMQIQHRCDGERMRMTSFIRLIYGVVRHLAKARRITCSAVNLKSISWDHTFCSWGASLASSAHSRRRPPYCAGSTKSPVLPLPLPLPTPLPLPLPLPELVPLPLPLLLPLLVPLPLPL